MLFRIESCTDEVHIKRFVTSRLCLFLSSLGSYRMNSQESATFNMATACGWWRINISQRKLYLFFCFVFLGGFFTFHPKIYHKTSKCSKLPGEFHRRFELQQDTWSFTRRWFYLTLKNKKRITTELQPYTCKIGQHNY